jgi:hypothetical protein
MLLGALAVVWLESPLGSHVQPFLQLVNIFYISHPPYPADRATTQEIGGKDTQNWG